MPHIISRIKAQLISTAERISVIKKTQIIKLLKYRFKFYQNNHT